MTNPKSSRQFTRRKFLGATTASVAALTIVPRHVLGGPRFVSPSEKVNIAIIGAGGQGKTNMRALLAEPEAQIIAVCDPREQADYSKFYYGGTAGRKPVIADVEKHYSQKTPNYHCAEYEDFRQMLEKEKAVDAILCATPDHLHAYVSIACMKLGKHVYCEKPLTHNVWEARQVAKVAKETGVATQLGNQGHSGEGIRLTCARVWGGAPGGQGRERNRSRHAVGHPGPFRRGHPPDVRMDLGRRDREDARSPRLERRGSLGQSHWPSQRHSACACRIQLGPLARAAREPSVYPGIRPQHRAG